MTTLKYPENFGGIEPHL